MVGGGCGQRFEAFQRLDPRLPETAAISQAIQAPLIIEARLLQRFQPESACQAVRQTP